MGSYATLPEALTRGAGGLLMTNNNLAAEIALRAAQTQQAQAQTEDIQVQAAQRQQALDANKNLAALLQKPEVQQRIGQNDYSDILGSGVSPAVWQPVVKGLTEMRTTAQSLRKGDADFYAQGREQLKNTIEGLDAKDDTVAAQEWNQAVPLLVQQHPELAGQLPNNLPPDAGFRQQIQGLATHNGISYEMLKDAAAHEEAQGKAEKATAEGTKATLTTQAMQTALKDPAQGAALIDKAIPPTVDAQTNSSYKAAYQARIAAGDLEGAAQVVATAAGHAATIAQGNNALVIAGKAKAAGAEETARTKAQQNLSSELFKEIADPVERRRAQDDYVKASNEYQDKVSAINQNKQLISETQGGNKASGALVPIGELRQFVNRVNAQELKSVSSAAGNAWDRLQGVVSKYASKSGVPMSPEVLQDMQAVADGQLQTAKQLYQGKRNTLKTTYGLKNDLPEVQAPASAASAKPIVQHSASTGQYRYSSDGGKTWTAGQPPGQ